MAEFDLALDQETDFALDKDELSAILDYLDVHCEHDWTALQVSASTATGNKTKKPLRSSRFDILSLRQEVLELQDQLQILQEKYNLHRPIKSIRESSAQDWALIAYRERVSCTTAIRVNTDLQKRVLANRRLFDRIVKLCCRQQAQAMPKSVEIDLKCMPLANTAQVYHVLQVCLEYRIHSQLDSIVDRCSDSGHELQRHQWRLFPTGNRSLGVKFQESVAIPFRATFVRDALLHGPSIGALMNNAIGSCTTNVLPTKAEHEATIDMGQHIILRRIQSIRQGMLVIWEDASNWQSNQGAAPVSVRGSGWAFIKPASGFEDELSIVYSGGFFQLHSSDKSSFKPADRLTQDILAHIKTQQRLRISSLEAILISASCQQN